MNAVGRVWDSDVAYSFRNSPVAVWPLSLRSPDLSAVFALGGAVQPVRSGDLNLLDASLPPPGKRVAIRFARTDDRARHILGVIYGMQISLRSDWFRSCCGGPGVARLLSGCRRQARRVHHACDVMLSFPAILVALLIDGVARALPRERTTTSRSAC
jgi:peptide/nickel transport system permease protein